GRPHRAEALRVGEQPDGGRRRNRQARLMSTRATLPRPILMLVTDGSRRAGGEPADVAWVGDIAREAALGGVNIVQLREKHLPRERLIDLGLHVRDAITDRALLFVNGDATAAVALRADGVHLPADGVPIA